MAADALAAVFDPVQSPAAGAAAPVEHAAGLPAGAPGGGL